MSSRGSLITLTVSLALLFITPNANAGSLTLAWDPPVDSVTAGYIIRGGFAPGQYAHAIDVGMATSYVISGLENGATFYFVVQAYNARGDLSPASSEVSGVARSAGGCASAPGVPNLNANAVGHIVNLAWSPGEGEMPTSYRLFVGLRPGHYELATVEFAASQQSLSSPAPFGKYFVRLAAVNACGVSAMSDEHTLQVLRPASLPPDPPSQPVPEWSERSLTVRWAPAATGGEAERFVLEVVNLQGRVITSFDVGGTTTFSASVPPGMFKLRVRAANQLGLSGPSPEVMVMLPQ